MGTENHVHEKSFSGFLDGYKAYNVAAIKEELDIELKDLREVFGVLKSQLSSAGLMQGPLDTQVQICSSRLEASIQNPLPGLTLFVEGLVPVLSEIKRLSKESFSSAKRTADQLVLLVLKIAKKARDPELSSAAVRIGNSLL